MPRTIQKSFRLPIEIATALEEKLNSTEYLVSALQEKFRREEEERFRASARRIAAKAPEERDVEFAFSAQAEIVNAE